MTFSHVNYVKLNMNKTNDATTFLRKNPSIWLLTFKPHYKITIPLPIRRVHGRLEQHIIRAKTRKCRLHILQHLHISKSQIWKVVFEKRNFNQDLRVSLNLNQISAKVSSSSVFQSTFWISEGQQNLPGLGLWSI